VPDDVSIRDARTEDAEAFVRAHELAWDAMAGPIVGTSLAELVPFESRVESFRAGLAKASADAHVWVAERAGVIVGEAICVCEAEACELRDLFVVPDAWGSGVAQALLETALAAMRECGATEALLWVVEANVRARRFYEREGWTADGETRTSPLGPRELRYRRVL